MKNIYKIMSAALVVAGLSAATGCSKFLDINANPNVPEKAANNLILPSTQAGIGMLVGNSMLIPGSFYAQYWTQNTTSSQYKTTDQYLLSSNDFDRMWGIMYNNVLTDLDVLTKQTTNSQYAAIGYIEKGYVYQLITDAFGDVPLKEAIAGTANTNPKYDTQKEVYDSIITWVKKGISIADPSYPTLPLTEDLVFYNATKKVSDMAQWKRFGNTLLLKVYLRLSEVDPAKAQAGIQELYAGGAEFLTTDAVIKYTSTGGNQNPLYSESTGLKAVQNIVASSTAVNAFKANNDPRALYFYTPNDSLLKSTGQNVAVGIPQGSYATTIPAKDKDKLPSTPTAALGGLASDVSSATAPVKLISATESYFLQAEAVARGWATGDVATLFQNGVKASFTASGLASSAAAYLATAPDAQLPADKEGQIKAIITQKYYALCGTEGFEAWTEWRRTGYPNILTVSKATALGTLDLPARFLYPNSEVTRNLNFPGAKLITDRVWWDVK